jgi:hypothetical protein
VSALAVAALGRAISSAPLVNPPPPAVRWKVDLESDWGSSKETRWPEDKEGEWEQELPTYVPSKALYPSTTRLPEKSGSRWS